MTSNYLSTFCGYVFLVVGSDGPVHYRGEVFPWGPEGFTCRVGIVMGGPLCDREFLGLTETTLQTSQSCQDMSRSMAKFTEQIRMGWEQICQVCQLTTVLPKIDQQLTHIQIQDTLKHT